VKEQTSRPMVDIRGLGKAFSGVQVLRDVSLQVDPSDVVCLIGPSGSGKSTLLRCINFLEPYSAGDVRIDGRLVGYKEGSSWLQGQRERDPGALRNLRSEIGMVFQSFNLWHHMTALGNVTEALMQVRGIHRAKAAEIAMARLEQVGLASRANVYPAKLSGGQQQRVAIARALAMRPRIMLFDEPTSALDPELVGEVLEVMRQLADDGMTMIIATHEMGFAAKVADKVAFLDGGAIVQYGTPSEVLRGSPEPRVQRFLQTYHERNDF